MGIWLLILYDLTTSAFSLYSSWQLHAPDLYWRKSILAVLTYMKYARNFWPQFTNYSTEIKVSWVWTSSSRCVNRSRIVPIHAKHNTLLLLLLGAELPLMVENFGLLNELFPFPSILDAGYTIFNLHLANILFDVILPSVLGYSLWSFG